MNFFVMVQFFTSCFSGGWKKTAAGDFHFFISNCSQLCDCRQDSDGLWNIYDYDDEYSFASLILNLW